MHRPITRLVPIQPPTPTPQVSPVADRLRATYETLLQKEFRAFILVLTRPVMKSLDDYHNQFSPVGNTIPNAD